jgi:hypothetical protein
MLVCLYVKKNFIVAFCEQFDPENDEILLDSYAQKDLNS